MNVDETLASAADLLISELSGLCDRADEDLEALREELREDNADLAPALEGIVVRDVISHPKVQTWLEAHAKSLFEHITYMQG